MEAGELYANVTCDYGYVIPGTDVDFVRIRCKGQTWSKAITECTGTKTFDLGNDNEQIDLITSQNHRFEGLYLCSFL